MEKISNLRNNLIPIVIQYMIKRTLNNIHIDREQKHKS